MKKKLILVGVAPFMLLASGQGAALEFGKNELRGQIDTTLSYGITSRVQDRDKSLIGIGNCPPGECTSYGANADDGNLNYDKGIVSNAIKVTSEMELSYRSYGAFVRVTAFHDAENASGSHHIVWNHLVS